MHSVFDELELTIECPQCRKQVKDQAGRIKRLKAIRCVTCGRIDINTDRIEKLVLAVHTTERTYADLGRNLCFTLE
jgi:hypothetical protein